MVSTILGKSLSKHSLQWKAEQNSQNFKSFCTVSLSFNYFQSKKYILGLNLITSLQNVH